jgi:predicted membrane channel-forming protein YqfA (hemolysin III family)
MTAGPAHDVGPTSDNRAQAPIRWPRPEPASVVLGVIYAIGLIVALAVPALIVPPSSTHPQVGRTWFAFLFTVIGAGLMLVSALVHFRRKRDGTILTIATVSAITVFLGGIILVATKLGGGYAQS